MDIEQIRADWHKRGFSCDVWVDTPGQHWEGFVHATNEPDGLFSLADVAGIIFIFCHAVLFGLS